MPERILLYRPGFLGDVVMSMPAVRLVRQYNPDAHIVYATNPPCDQLLSACPWIDEVRKAGTYRHAEFDKMCHFSHEQYWDVKKYWGALHIKNAQAVFIEDIDNVGYVITYDAPEEVYDNYADGLELVMSTFEFSWKQEGNR